MKKTILSYLTVFAAISTLAFTANATEKPTAEPTQENKTKVEYPKYDEIHQAGDTLKRAAIHLKQELDEGIVPKDHLEDAKELQNNLEQCANVAKGVAVALQLGESHKGADKGPEVNADMKHEKAAEKK